MENYTRNYFQLVLLPYFLSILRRAASAERRNENMLASTSCFLIGFSATYVSSREWSCSIFHPSAVQCYAAFKLPSMRLLWKAIISKNPQLPCTDHIRRTFPWTAEQLLPMRHYYSPDVVSLLKDRLTPVIRIKEFQVIYPSYDRRHCHLMFVLMRWHIHFKINKISIHICTTYVRGAKLPFSICAVRIY